MPPDPRTPPCDICGREVDECVCGFANDIPDDEQFYIPEIDDQMTLDWDIYEEDINEDDRSKPDNQAGR